MARREILNPDIDPMAVIDELAQGAVTDGRGLTLGDVAGHRRDRFFTLWRALHLLGGLAKRGLLRPTDQLEVVGARVQDNQAIGVFQAAHVLPCDFRLNGGEKAGLHALFASPIIAGNVKAHLFGRTNAVHRLVNYVDSRCEDHGWCDAFRIAIDRLVGGAPPEVVFRRDLVPAYAAAVASAREAFERDISKAERGFIDTPVLLAPNGLPARPRGQDFRISDKLKDPRARAANKAAVLQVYAEYRLGPAGVSPAEMDAAARELDAWAELERQWRSKHA